MSELYVPVLDPKDVVRHLASPTHWKAGYSAQELAYSWFTAEDFPKRVRECLATDSVFKDAILLDSFFERKTTLDTAKAPSQTDLLAYVDLGDQLGLIAVEGKVEESFDRYVRNWSDGSPTRTARLEYLCGQLKLNSAECGHLRYQLLHRTVSAIREAQRYHVREAILLVHSFSVSLTSFDEFSVFAANLNLPIAGTNRCSAAAIFDGVRLRLAWVADAPRLTEG